MQQDDSFPRAQICKPWNCGASLQFVMALYQSSASVSKLISALNGYSSKYDVGAYEDVLLQRLYLSTTWVGAALVLQTIFENYEFVRHHLQ